MARLTHLRLEHVHYMPKELESGVLYVSKEFGAAAHLCACGCGAKVRTPLGQTEWRVVETNDGPTLSPSVGNWQLPCRSHYVIKRGRIQWAGDWTDEDVLAGRRNEEQRREAYFADRDRLHLDQRRPSIWRRFWRWLIGRISL